MIHMEDEIDVLITLVLAIVIIIYGVKPEMMTKNEEAIIK